MPLQTDVLHVMFTTYWPDKRTSIVKIVENLLSGIPGLAQRSVVSPRDLDVYVNHAKPRILHLHYTGHHPENVFLERLTCDPYVVHTVHDSQESIFSDVADRIICISRFGMERNDPRKTVYIENSVEVGHAPRHAPNDNGVCLALRFSADQMQERTIEVLSKVRGLVHIYGADDALAFNAEHNRSILALAEQYRNIVCSPYNNYMEYQLSRHAFYGYYIQDNEPRRSYGLTVMEAVSLGMPVVAVRRRQDGQQFIVHGYNGYIADDDEEFVEYCSLLSEDREHYRCICANASEHARTIENSMPGRHELLYRSLLDAVGVERKAGEGRGAMG